MAQYSLSGDIEIDLASLLVLPEICNLLKYTMLGLGLLLIILHLLLYLSYFNKYK